MRITARAAFAALEFIERLAGSKDLRDPDLRDALRELRAGKIHARHLTRRPGRPHKGRIQVSRERFEELPKWVSLSEAARILGVSYETLRRWAKQPPGFPAERRGRYRALSVQRHHLKEYLASTDRYFD